MAGRAGARRGLLRRGALVPVAVLALLLLAGDLTARGAGTVQSGTAVVVRPLPTAGSPAPVVMPGRPGEPATVDRAGRIPAAPAARYNSLDVLYVQMMIPHHTQALQMAALAPTRAGDARIKVLAERIRSSQVPEILRMRGWLTARGIDGGDGPSTGHDHGGMPGMQTPEALDRLAAARGASFDRLFVQMMIDHHRGAIEMSDNVLRVGVDTAVEEMATSAASEQAVEIGRMRDLLSG